MAKIIGTPFRLSNAMIAKRTNLRIRGLVGKAELSKRQNTLRDLKDTIDSKRLPNVAPGAIE